MKHILALATLALLASAGLAFAQQAGIPIQTPQGTVTIPDATVQWLCGNDGAWIKWIISQLGPWASYIFGYLGLSVSASALANFNDKLPAPIRMIVNVLALNLRNAKPPAINPNLSAPKGP